MKNIDTSNLTQQQHTDILALYNLSKEQFPTTPAYFLWLIAVDYYMKDVVGKKQRNKLKNPLIDERVKEMKSNNKSSNHTNILKLMSINTDNNDDLISKVNVEA